MMATVMAGHVASIIGKRRATHASTNLTLSFLYSLESWPMEWCHLSLGQLFHAQANFSGSIHTKIHTCKCASVVILSPTKLTIKITCQKYTYCKMSLFK